MTTTKATMIAIPSNSLTMFSYHYVLEVIGSDQICVVGKLSPRLLDIRLVT